ncbi:MAG: hypothetical protein ACX930_08515 [Erythrobacter sp.]
MANQELSGGWDGTFYYPDVPEAGPATPFLARITDRGGALTGTVIEPNEFREGTAHATLVGQRVGRSVHFAKDYHDAGWEYAETVLYNGTLNEDGDTITGEWSIDHWRGTFEMSRQSVANEGIGSEVEAEIHA